MKSGSICAITYVVEKNRERQLQWQEKTSSSSRKGETLPPISPEYRIQKTEYAGVQNTEDRRQKKSKRSRQILVA